MTGTGTLAEVSRWMADQVGFREGPGNDNPYSHGMGHPDEAWCADFVADAFRICGVPQTSTSAYTPTVSDAYKRAGRWTIYPRAGDQGFVFSPSAGRVIHTFWVRALGSGVVYTVEGNTNDDGSSNGNGVYRRTRARLKTPRGAGVIGYGRPLYKSVIVKPGTRLTLSRYLQVGNSGLAVTNLQKRLNAVLIKYTLHVDGQFGPATKRSVIQFQKDLHLTQDGVVGPSTARALGWVWVG